MRVAALYSGGKDSNAALYLATLKGMRVACLITIRARREDSMMFHVPAIEMTRLQSEALGIPQIFFESRGDEIEDLRMALRMAVDEYDVEGVVTGALLSDYQRMRINMVCEDLGLKTFCPLWRKRQDEYMIELIEMGFKFIITSISTYGLPPSLLGKVLTMEDVIEINRRARIYGFNPAFEGGEAETLVLDMPLFRRRIEIRRSRPMRLSEYEWRLIVEEAELVDKE